jgi:glyoxylase-like metal-dependent hydrolase (beta-lactamase superfamily II)
LKVSTYRSSPDAFFVNSHLLELQNQVVVVDTQFVLPEAAKLVEAVVALKKPLGAILLTHPHPDHVNGTAALLDRWPGVPVYATQATRSAMMELAAPKRAQWKPILGAAYPDSIVEPTYIVGDGETVTIENTSFKFYDLGAMESLNESIIELVAEKVAFVGDLFYNKVHPWLVEGRALRWREILDRVSAPLSRHNTLYPGHGESAAPAALQAQAAYMDHFFALVRRIGKDRDVAQVVAEMKSTYPGWPLEMLIEMNIEPVRNELQM